MLRALFSVIRQLLDDLILVTIHLSSHVSSHVVQELIDTRMPLLVIIDFVDCPSPLIEEVTVLDPQQLASLILSASERHFRNSLYWQRFVRFLAPR